MVNKKQKQSFKTKYSDKGFNLVSIIAGIIITFVIWYFISMITYTIIPPANSNMLDFDLIYSVELIGISIIGGFLSTYIGKEEQLLNGMCWLRNNTYFNCIKYICNIYRPAKSLLVQPTYHYNWKFRLYFSPNFR